MSGLVFAVLSAIGFGLANGISQRYVHDLGVGATMFARSLVSSIILLLVLLAYPVPLTWSGIGIAAAVTSLGIVAVFAYYRSLDLGHSGVVTPIANSAVVVTVITGFIIFGETLGGLEYLLIALILVGSVLLSREPSEDRVFARGIAYAVLAMLFWGVTYALLALPTRLIGPLPTALVGEMLALIAGGIWFVSMRQRIPLERRVVLALIVIGAGVAMGVAGFTFAIQTVPIGVVAAISASNPAVTAIYMRIVHGERLRAMQRLGSILVICCVVLLSLL